MFFNPAVIADSVKSEKIEDIEEAFASLQKSIRSMEIPESITSPIGQEFIAFKQGNWGQQERRGEEEVEKGQFQGSL